MRRFTTILLPLALLLACEGPMGPEGPPGPQGERGLPGPPGADATANRAQLTGLPDADGNVEVLFPAALNDPDEIPRFSCYRQNPQTGSWWVVTDGFSVSSAWCLAIFEQGRWVGVMFNVPQGWRAAFVVVW